MRDVTTGEARSWYVVRTHPRQEQRTESNLMAWRVETFAPRIKKRRYNQFTSEPVETIKPLFPRYIFARFDLNSLLHKVRYARGVESVISFGERPSPVHDEVITLIQSRIGEDGLVKLGENLKPGDEVMINDGPMKSFVGIFEREMKGDERVMILLNTLNYQARCQIDRSLVRKVS